MELMKLSLTELITLSEYCEKMQDYYDGMDIDWGLLWFERHGIVNEVIENKITFIFNDKAKVDIITG